MASRSAIARLAFLLVVAVRHLVAHVAAATKDRWPRLAGRLPVTSASGPERLRMALEGLGGSFIKFGQMLALQPDLIGLEYCAALFNLLDRVAPFDYAAVERTLVEELGRPPEAIFDRFDRQPLATASIGQVHIAHLNGRKLAVKVQRPQVDQDFAGDIRLMSALMRVIRLFRLRWLYWMLEPLGEFVVWTREELDYRLEARYMDRLRRNARDNPYERVPAVLWELTTRRVLVAEFLDGSTILSYLRAREAGDEVRCRRLRSTGFQPDDLALHIIDNFLGDVFRHGMFHADLHPANLMILPGNVVGYLDFGITGVISAYSRRHLVGLTLAYTRGDLDAMCTAFFRVSARGPSADTERFRGGLKALASTWYQTRGRTLELRKNFTLVMLDMVRLSRHADIWPERDVIKYIRSAIAIDGLITRLAPTFDIGRHLRTVCNRYLKWEGRQLLLTPEAMVGWSTSAGHLLRDGVMRAASALDRLGSLGAGGPAGAHSSAPRPPASRAMHALAGGALVLAAAANVLSPPVLDPPLAGEMVTLTAAASVALMLAAFRVVLARG